MCPGFVLGKFFLGRGVNFHREMCDGNVTVQSRGMPGVGVSIPIQDYKSLHAAVMISSTQVNTHTDRQLTDQLKN